MKSKITAVVLKTSRLLVSRKLFLFVLCTPFLLVSACESSDDDPIFCTQEVGTYQETLEFLPGLEHPFSGADERMGTYIITVTKSGYQTYTSPPIVVTRDVCHVITQSLTVNLQSN